MIDQKDYQLLKTIGEQGSVQRAASAIGVSWPSVSKRLAKIEEKLQVLSVSYTHLTLPTILLV